MDFERVVIEYEPGFRARAAVLIAARRPFTVRVRGIRARLLRHVLPTFGAAPALTAQTVALLLGITLLGVLAAVVLYALSKGYRVRARANVKDLTVDIEADPPQ